MTPKPDARLFPTQEEFDAWAEHPVTRFVAAAYDQAAANQRAMWGAMFDPAVTADLPHERLILKTREDAYRSFMENTLADYSAIVTGGPGARPVRATEGIGRSAERGPKRRSAR